MSLGDRNAYGPSRRGVLGSLLLVLSLSSLPTMSRFTVVASGVIITKPNPSACQVDPPC